MALSNALPSEELAGLLVFISIDSFGRECSKFFEFTAFSISLTTF